MAVTAALVFAVAAGGTLAATTVQSDDDPVQAVLKTPELGIDLEGGVSAELQLAGDDIAIGNFAGLILGTMMGPTIVFTIPVALGIISKSDRSYLGAGVLAGLITVPIGCIVGGLAMSAMTEYKLTFMQIIINLVPVIVIAALIVIGLWFAPGPMIKGFNVFGTGVTIVITAFTAIAVFQQITGIITCERLRGNA